MLSADRAQRLKPFLEALLEGCDHLARRDADPVGLVWGFDAPEDREVAALIVSALAYGRVEVLRRAAADALSRMGPSPADFARTASAEALREAFGGFVYRMTRGEDLADLVAGIGASLRAHGSIEAAYANADVDVSVDDGIGDVGTGDGAAEVEHLARTSALVQVIRAGRLRHDLARGVRYLLPDPLDGSTAKRLHLFLRWMVRGPDGVDLGLWSSVAASALVMPLDTHTSRLCRYLGLTERRSNDLRAAREVSASLRLLDPLDPLRFDFALCHLGISGGCVHRRSEEHCPGCPIEPVCGLI